MNVEVRQENGKATLYLVVNGTEELNANKAFLLAMDAGFFFTNPKLTVIVHAPDLNKNVSDFILALSIILVNYGLQQTIATEIKLHVLIVGGKNSETNAELLTALRIKTKDDFDKLGAITITRNAQVKGVALPSSCHKLDSYVWINALTPDKSISMKEILTKHCLPTNVTTFVNSSDLNANDIAYLKKQVANIVFIDNNKEDSTISNVTASRVLMDMLDIPKEDIKPTARISEEDVLFTISIDKLGNKSLEIDFGNTTISTTDIDFENNKLAFMKLVAKTALYRMYPDFIWSIEIVNNKLHIASTGAESYMLVPSKDVNKQQIEYILTRTVYFTMAIGRYLKGEIESDAIGDAASMYKWYHRNVKYIIE